ncbi:MAG: hypothetical protein QG673_2141 [Pseudomonadota bacterium]|nr:hypothetical protein [Pseudomonadota bacterium]
MATPINNTLPRVPSATSNTDASSTNPPTKDYGFCYVSDNGNIFKANSEDIVVRKYGTATESQTLANDQLVNTVICLADQKKPLSQKIDQIILLSKYSFSKDKTLIIASLRNNYSQISDVLYSLKDISVGKDACLEGMLSDNIYQLKLGCCKLIEYIWNNATLRLTKQFIQHKILAMEEPLKTFLASTSFVSDKYSDVELMFNKLLAEIKN